MKLLIVVLAVVMLAACGCGERSTVSKAKFRNGAIVEFVVSKQKAQVLDTNCFYDIGCVYSVRVAQESSTSGTTTDYRKTEVLKHIKEFELQESSL